jgi:multidrug efflux pump subunit AcrA (membrane-fusion protein)
MLIYVPEHLMSAAPTATDLRCEFDAFPGILVPAEFKEIGTEADPVTRTYPITLVMDQPEGARILPGMTGNAWAVRRPNPPDPGGGAFTIPLSALGEDAGGARFVWVVNEQQGTVSRKEIEVGELVLGGVRVRGLQEGELIATAGAAFLSEGQQIEPVLAPSGDGA